MADEKTKLEQFFDNQASAALWDVAVSLKRGNALPLDADSVFQSMDKVNEYRNGGGPAYPGQIIAIVEETGTQICYLDKDLNVCPVGIIPTGDNKSIEVSATGAISLLGAAGAADGTLPMLEDGALVWKTLEDIGAGDGNDNTTYEFSFANQKITITPKENGVAQTAIELDLTGFVTADELKAVTGDVAEGKTLAGMIADALAEAKQYADDNDANDNTEYHIEYDSEAKEIKLVSGADSSKMTIDATPFIKDGMLHDVEYDAEKNTLTFTWNTDAGTKTDEVVLSDIIEPYTAGDGLNLEGNEFSVKVDAESESFLSVGANGVKLAGVQSAINSAVSSKADASAVYTKEEANDLLNAKANAADVYGKSDVYTKSEADAKIDEKIASVTGGESAADVKLALESYRDALNKEVWGDDAGSWTTTKTEDGKTVVTYTPAYGTESRIDLAEGRLTALENVGAQANVIETVQGVTGNRLSVKTEGKVVTIDDTDLRTDIADAKKAGDDAAEAASTNAQAITGHDNRIATLEGASTQYSEAITALQGEDTSLKGRVSDLEASVNNETSGLAATYAKVGKNTSDIAALLAADKVHDDDIAALKVTVGNHGTSIGQLEQAVANVYTKSETDGKFVAKETGKSLISNDEIARLAEVDNYDDTAIRALITDITKEGGTIATAVAAEAAIARAAEKKNADDIAAINAVLNTVDSEDTITSLKELAIWVEEHGGEAAEMAKGIEDNAKAIAAINDTTNGILVTAKGYTDTQISALQATIHGVDDKTIKLKENKAYVAEVSTDVLVQGENELIFSAGNASGYITN